MSELQYKGYVIIAHPEQLVENNEWTVEILIEKTRGGSVSDKPFSESNTFQSKEKATERCFNFGKQIIDGQVKNCSVDDL